MSFASILILSVGLAMDATAAAAARGAVARGWRPVFAVAALFGGFQAAMPLLGWLVGRELGARAEAWDHWIAFGLLVAIGVKMLWEARPGAAPREPGARLLVLLAIATSIDALAAGVTLPILGAPLLLSIATIGVTTAALSALGFLAGRRLGRALGGRLDVVGGVILIALGVKILVEHLTA